MSQFDLPKVMQDCNSKLIEMDETKRGSVSSKKNLAEQTRNFNKLTAEESVGAVQDLLRLYQIEIESLSKRCKLAENSFSSLVSSLTPLPNPATLEAMVRQVEPDQTVVLELRKTIKDLESEMSTLKNQDVTVRRLEKRVHEVEAEKQSEISTRESMWAQRVEQVRGETETRLQSLQDQIAKSKREYEALLEESRSTQKNTLMEKNRYEEMIGSKNNEVENLRRQVEQLREEQVRLNATVSSSSSTHNISLYKDIISQSEDRISKLQTELEKARESEAKSKASEEAVKQKLAAETTRLSSEKNALQQSIEKVMKEVSSLGKPDGVKSMDDVAVVIGRMKSSQTDSKARLDEFEKEMKNLTARNRELEAAVVKANTELEKRRVEVNTSDGDVRFGSSSGVRELEMTSTQQVNSGDPSDMVSILTSQRDRFRNRADELESERDQLKQNHMELNNKINVLMTDMRRMEQERNFWRNSSQNKSGSNSDVESGGGIGRSSGSVTPPVLFSKLKKAANGGDFEQAATSLIVYGIGNPMIRRVALVYFLTLHLLVFMVLYRLSSIVSTDSSNQ